MTEKSWLWDGTAIGDATLAPYDKDIFNKWFAISASHDYNRVYVLPGIYNDLFISPIATQSYATVQIASGAAIVGKYIYISDETIYFNIDSLSSSGFYRYDSIILRLNKLTQEIRLAILRGEEAASSPVPPTLTQNNTTWEIEIARIYIDSVSFVVDEEHLSVYLHFLPIGPYFNSNPNNIILDPECFEYVPRATTDLPAWVYFKDIGTLNLTSSILPQTRGGSITLTNGSASDHFVQTCGLALKENDPFTIEGIIKLNDSTTAVDIICYLYETEHPITLGAAFDYFNSPTPDSTYTIRIIGSGTHHIKRTFYAQQDIGSIRIFIKGQATTNNFSIGQFLMSPGYFTGGIRSRHKIYPLVDRHSNTSWDGDAKSSGTTQIDLTTSFGGYILPHIRGLVLKVQARDSGSAANTNVYVQILSYNSTTVYGELRLDGVPNNDIRSRHIMVYTDEPFHTSLSAIHGFAVLVSATGAGTMDVWIDVVGIIT